MQNPGYKAESTEPIFKVTMRRTAVTPAPHTLNGGYGVPPEPPTKTEDIETPPPATGVPSPNPVSSTNGAPPIAGTEMIRSQPAVNAGVPQDQEANRPANQRRINTQQQVGGGQKENPAYDRAQNKVDERVQRRRMSALYPVAAQLPNEDPVYPYRPQDNPENDTVDLDNLQSGDDSFRPHHPLVDRVVNQMQGLPDMSRNDPRLMDRVNEILDQGPDTEENNRGADALAMGLNTIFDSGRETEGLPREERLQRAKDAIDAHIETGRLTHKQYVQQLHDDWEARGGHKTGEPRPVTHFSPRYTKPQQIVPDPNNPFPELTSPIHMVGKCNGCGKKLYDSADSSGDPRGALGDNTVGHINASDYDATDVPREERTGERRMHGPSALICPECDSDYDRHRRVVDKYLGHKAGEPTGGFHWERQHQPDGSFKSVRVDYTHHQDKKGKWHNPGEKEGSCPECDQGITGFHSRQASISSQSTGIDRLPGQHHNAYSRYMDRLGSKHGHVLHQSALVDINRDDDTSGLRYFRDTEFNPPNGHSFTGQPMLMLKDDSEEGIQARYPGGGGCETCWLKHDDDESASQKAHEDYSYGHPFKPFTRDLGERLGALRDWSHDDEENGLRHYVDDEILPKPGQGRIQPMLKLKNDNVDYSVGYNDPGKDSCETCWLQYDMPNVDRESHEGWQNHLFKPFARGLGERAGALRDTYVDEDDNLRFFNDSDIMPNNARPHVVQPMLTFKHDLNDIGDPRYPGPHDGCQNCWLQYGLSYNPDGDGHERIYGHPYKGFDREHNERIAALDADAINDYLNRRFRKPEPEQGSVSEADYSPHEPDSELGPECETCRLQYGQGVHQDLHDQFLKHPFKPSTSKTAGYDLKRREFLYDVDDPDEAEHASPYYYRDSPPSRFGEGGPQEIFSLKGGHYDNGFPSEDDEGYAVNVYPRVKFDDSLWHHTGYPRCQGCIDRGLDTQSPDSSFHSPTPVGGLTEYGRHAFSPAKELGSGERLASYDRLHSKNPGIRLFGIDTL